jgi:hypothetical protein
MEAHLRQQIVDPGDAETFGQVTILVSSGIRTKDVRRKDTLQ